MNIRTLIENRDSGNPPFGFPYVIAEAGVNHGCTMDLAKRLINEAQEGGAHAIKFQTYKAETIASKHSPAYWDTQKEPTSSQYELFKKYDLFWKKEYELLRKQCDQVGIDFLSTPFDRESALFLNDMMDVFKISSSDITNKPFIEYIGSFGKPIILSTGASHLFEIEQAVEWIDSLGVPLALLHCVLNYPTDDENANLGMILDLKTKYPNKVIGYSDHTLPKDMRTLETAVLLGAEIIEKHFTYDKILPGNDHYHAMDREDLKLFLANMKRITALVGSLKKYPLVTEDSARKNARRSIVLARTVAAGEIFQAADLTYKRPAHGISPVHWNEVIGRRARTRLEADHVLDWSDIA